MHSCEICKVENVELLLCIECSQLWWYRHVTRLPHGRLARQICFFFEKWSRFWPIEKWSRFWPSTRLHLWLGPVFVWSQQASVMVCWNNLGISRPPGIHKIKANVTINIQFCMHVRIYPRRYFALSQSDFCKELKPFC